ncbi:MAG: Long-chain-fatty-acid--CoA ligase [uncultured Solirubrobacteraceae bacterium]|uniref:Long-chain-fatty-acid--CoA ligase n=1 Tax=uncultured Solirubrobacteraceae bacterium TaxID=1162706 RepID=A0A6J4SQN3_9ACTN|nr:MAG: Long-chain-fatty-acid--CoA ligase [uncultured Solirubrobacteraceae bacterium]
MLLDTLSTKALTARTLIECGMFGPTRPDKLVRALKALKDWGPTTAGGYTTSSIRYPDDVSIIDEAGSLTFDEVHRRTNALAHAWSDEGIGEGDNVALLCRNHRGFVEAMVACSKLGAHALFLNTAFAGPQLAEICAREQPRAIVYDEEFDELIGAAAQDSRRFIAWSDGGTPPAGADLLETLIERGDPADVVVPATKGKIVILTSGTTGTPKGANRKQPETLDPIAGLIEKIPLRARGRTLIAAPLFHSWGLAHFILAIGLSSTLILRRRFDPQDTLSAIDEHGATALIVVPVMLQRILELGPKTLGRYDTGSLRVIAASGSALPGELATKVMDTFGDILYNLYGSTEVAWATVATPEDLRAAPGTAGRPPRGTVVRLYDADDEEVAPGETGRIFVGNELCFDGYSGGGQKARIDGLMSSGDVGHFDEDGRLFVDGRDDEMIVSGGENVFPREVEDTIARLAGIEEVAAVGVEDGDFGQRLKAFVVVREGATVSEQDVKAHVKENLARFKVPRDVVFLDALPRNATGKVLKRELVKLP